MEDIAAKQVLLDLELITIIAPALQWNPTSRIYNQDGSPVIIPEFGNSSINPVALLDAFKDKVNTDRKSVV